MSVNRRLLKHRSNSKGVPARPFKRQDKNPLKVNSNNNNNGEIDFTNNNKRYTFRNKNIYLNIIYTK